MKTFDSDELKSFTKTLFSVLVFSEEEAEIGLIIFQNSK